MKAAVSAADQLDALLARLAGLPEDQRKVVEKLVETETGSLAWVPNPGPQTEAYYSKADQLLYGGEVGGGKTDILLGLASQEHQRSLILRRHNKEVDFLADRLEEIVGHKDGYNGQKHVWRLGKRLLQFGGCQHLGDEKGYKGQPKDFIGFDEASEFLESMVEYIITWLRSGDVTQRCRLVLATNPPTTVDGEWLIRWFAPWLDPHHSLYPYPEGDLLYFKRRPDTENEFDFFVDEPEPEMLGGQPVRALTRTFIRSGLRDNPDYDRSDYRNRLAMLPETLRRRYAEGDFTLSAGDADNQVIPTAWILAAQARWKEDGWKDWAMTAMGFDPAGGGRDSAELAYRHGGWYGRLISAQGKDTADGSLAAATIIQHRRDRAPVVVDAGGGAGHGFGGTTIMRLRDNGIDVEPFNGAGPSSERTKDGLLRFSNLRAWCYWRFREALDPDQEGGSVIALPPDAELKAELAAPTYEVTAKGILVEDKKAIRKRLGRSPGKADAVVMALAKGNVAVKRQLGRLSGTRQKFANRDDRHAKVRRHNRRP